MVGIIFIGDLRYCPYLSKYVNILEEKNIDYEVLYWNREDAILKDPKNYFSFNLKSRLNRNPIFKIKDFISFRCWLKNKINLTKYEKLILLSTLSGIIISDILIKKYIQKYIFDIRDFSYENYRFFLKREENLIKNSYSSYISSKGFENFLPIGYKYNIIHNFNKNDLRKGKKFFKKPYGSTLNIVWIGAIRYFEHQKKIIDKLCNDNRFKLIYHGTGPQFDIFKKYCNDNNATNVIFTGEYNNNEKYKLLEDADILNNSYNTSKIMEVKYAISNKYYDGLIFGIPQLVEIETFKSEIVESNGVGIALNPQDKKFADELYDYYYEIDEETFNNYCKSEIKKVLLEDEECMNSIKKFLC